jgi:hypothetical protein
MPNIYNPTDLSDLDGIKVQINDIRSVLPASNGALINTEENAIDAVGKALKDGSIANSGVEVLYGSVQDDDDDEITIRLKSAPNTIFYANETGLLVPLTIGNGLIVENGALVATSANSNNRSTAKNKLIYEVSSQYTNWYGGISGHPNNLNNGEGGMGSGGGESGMLASDTSAVAVTATLDSPKWLNQLKVYPGQYNGIEYNRPNVVEIFAGNTTNVLLSAHAIAPGETTTIDTLSISAYTTVGKQTQYTFLFSNTLQYVAVRELVLWGDD